MNADDIKSVVHEVLNEQRILSQNDIDRVALKTIATILTSFGISEDDRLELKADFSHLRRWRKSSEAVGAYTVKAIVTILVGGFLGALWMGFKAILGK